MTSRRRKIDWPAVAMAFARRISHGALHPGAMLTALAHEENAQRKNPRHKPRWAVAFSGGADSLALLLIFWAEGPGRWGRDFVALHFNHRLRGRAADADEKLCAEVCAALGIKFAAGRWRQPPAAASEAAARAARFEFFGREMKRRKLELLWFGHQQDDIAETMLMRLARGSGTGGLAAPRPAQAMPGGRWHLRPLLTLKKVEIVAALKAAGAVWCEDETNSRPDYFRNRVRRAVLPAWRRAAGERDALAGAALSRELLEEDDAAVEAWLAELAPVADDGALWLRRIAGKPRGLVRRAVHRWLAWNRAGEGLSRQAFNALLDDVMRGRRTRHSLGSEVQAEIGRTRARVVRGPGKKRPGFHRGPN